MRWWKEVKPAGVCFGGPTGVYSIIVLMSWWCSLLKGQPDDKLTDFLHVIDDIDQVILSSIQGITGQPCPTSAPGSPPSEMSTITPDPHPHGSKRTVSKELLPRKHLRHTKA